MTRAFSLFLAVALTTMAAWAASATVSWLPNPEPDIASYRVYYHASDTNAVQTVSTTNTQTLVDGLVPGKLYLFRVSALNTAQFESPRSATVSYYVSTIGPGVPSTNALPSPVLAKIKL